MTRAEAEERGWTFDPPRAATSRHGFLEAARADARRQLPDGSRVRAVGAAETTEAAEAKLLRSIGELEESWQARGVLDRRRVKIFDK